MHVQTVIKHFCDFPVCIDYNDTCVIYIFPEMFKLCFCTFYFIVLIYLPILSPKSKVLNFIDLICVLDLYRSYISSLGSIL